MQQPRPLSQLLASVGVGAGRRATGRRERH
jgi:hypothetical protein